MPLTTSPAYGPRSSNPARRFEPDVMQFYWFHEVSTTQASTPSPPPIKESL